MDIDNLQEIWAQIRLVLKSHPWHLSLIHILDAMERGKVLAVRKNSLFSFTFAGGKCDVKFRKSGKDCIVSLRQYGIPTDEKLKVGTHMSCQIGWTFFFANLKSVLESGTDLREFNPKYLKEGTVFY